MVGEFIFTNKVRGMFVYVNYIVYLCIVIMIRFSHGRGTDVSWGVLREPALYII